ncbi:hypothetical protein BD413DRAFT_302407 [Trametes elegans]|nr:hypothetical protein BD413DRAFT_302407 [Trametes elegans]
MVDVAGDSDLGLDGRQPMVDNREVVPVTGLRASDGGLRVLDVGAVEGETCSCRRHRRTNERTSAPRVLITPGNEGFSFSADAPCECFPLLSRTSPERARSGILYGHASMRHGQHCSKTERDDTPEPTATSESMARDGTCSSWYGAAQHLVVEAACEDG